MELGKERQKGAEKEREQNEKKMIREGYKRDGEIKIVRKKQRYRKSQREKN